jgi:cobalt-zinc-cadmium efflux system outer membrane protein
MIYRRILLLLAVCTVLGAQTRPGTVTLDQAIREAISNNLDLAAARYGVSVADTRMITARLRPNPVASASADHLDALGTGFNSLNNGGPPEYA